MGPSELGQHADSLRLQLHTGAKHPAMESWGLHLCHKDCGVSSRPERERQSASSTLALGQATQQHQAGLPLFGNKPPSQGRRRQEVPGKKGGQAPQEQEGQGSRDAPYTTWQAERGRSWCVCGCFLEKKPEWAEMTDAMVLRLLGLVKVNMPVSPGTRITAKEEEKWVLQYLPFWPCLRPLLLRVTLGGTEEALAI